MSVARSQKWTLSFRDESLFDQPQGFTGQKKLNVRMIFLDIMLFPWRHFSNEERHSAAFAVDELGQLWANHGCEDGHTAGELTSNGSSKVNQSKDEHQAKSSVYSCCFLKPQAGCWVESERCWVGNLDKLWWGGCGGGGFLSQKQLFQDIYRCFDRLVCGMIIQKNALSDSSLKWKVIQIKHQNLNIIRTWLRWVSAVWRSIGLCNSGMINTSDTAVTNDRLRMHGF